MKTLLSRFFRSELLLILFILLISGLLHGFNMFHYPYLENDEGVYMSQAWSLLKFGKLAPYTYWYDHAPAGWILIALWTVVTGGFFTFGASVNSGRVLMLLLHLVGTLLLYVLTKRLTKSKVAAVIACIFFACSPFGIYFQRRVLLDNLMTVWVLVSLYFATKSAMRLRHVVLSALTFGIAVLTKENAVFFAPGILYALWLYSRKVNKKFAGIYWISISFMIISLYFVYAILKQELFPTGAFGNSAPHVSLLQTLGYQLNRGVSLPFWDKRSEFMMNFAEWKQKDSLLILGGILATISTTLISIKNKQYRIISLLTISFWAFLLRGKMVIVFYILPLLPFLGMSIAASIASVLKTVLQKRKYIYMIGSLLVLSLISLYYFTGNHDYLTKEETSNQLRTLSWIKKNLPGDSRLVIDSSIFVDLHDAATKNETVFPNAEWVWKFEKDPEVLSKTFDNDWKNVQYITLSHEMLKQVRTSEFPLTRKALDNSVQLVDFTQNSTAYRNIPQYISTNGDWMSVYKVLDRKTILLQTAWQAYKKNYVYSYGQVIDPVTKQTTSTLQGEAMLQAAWIGDREAFDGIYSWTKDHFGYRGDHLFSSLWGMKGKTETVLNSESTTYADETIAFSLITAYNTWHDVSYLNDAKEILADIWKKEAIKSSTYGLFSGSDNSDVTDVQAFQPAMFHIFSTIDTEHPWNKLASDSTSTLTEFLKDEPNADKPLSSSDISNILIALGMDHKLFNTLLPEATVGDKYKNNPAYPLFDSNIKEANNLLQKNVLSSYNESTGVFGNKNTILLQRQGFIITALYYNLLPHSSH